MGECEPCEEVGVSVDPLHPWAFPRGNAVWGLHKTRYRNRIFFNVLDYLDRKIMYFKK